MNKAQQQHIARLTQTFSNLAYKKYEAGAQEHGGNLWEVDTLPLLYMLREECIDAFVYLQTVIDELEGNGQSS